MFCYKNNFARLGLQSLLPNMVKEPYLQFIVEPHPGFASVAACAPTGRTIREGAVPVRLCALMWLTIRWGVRVGQ